MAPNDLSNLRRPGSEADGIAGWLERELRSGAWAEGCSPWRRARPCYLPCAQLVLALQKAKEQGRLDIEYADLAKADLLILDEFGYIPFDSQGAKLLFQVISSCYETKSVILTTNIEFSKWGAVLADEKLAAAAVDRIIHHGRLVEFGGKSRRVQGSLMLGNAEEG